ncbi:MAG: glycosyltransferase family 39 protein, partial [Acidobacteriota bacterium]|nr:glycosyltransferase family 39 protein [Acidobacteriota bacterium]
MMLVIFTIIFLSLIRQKSLFVDDTMHIPAGYSYVMTNDFRLNQEHPPFIKILSGLGLIFVRPELPFDSEGWKSAEEPGDPDDGTTAFEEDFFNRNAGKYDQITFWGRAPVLIVPLLLALCVWSFTKELYGETTALLAVFLLLTEPNIIGNATVVQDDLASALALFLYVITLRSYLKSPSVKCAINLGFVIGVALLIKHSLVVLVPVSLFMLLVHACWQKFRHKSHLCRFLSLGLMLVFCFYVILIAGYAFHVDWIDEDEAQFIADWLHLGGNSS